MAALMLSGMCASLQAELDALFGALEGRGGRRRAVRAQVFRKVRRGLPAELFELAQPHINPMRWHGLRLVAADGSRLRMGTHRVP